MAALKSHLAFPVLIVLFLFFFHPAISLVSVPEPKKVQTLFVYEETEQIYLERSPLINGPKWLPIHVTIILSTTSEDHLWDFVPKQPKDSLTLWRLLTLRSVPGLIRYRTRAPKDIKNSRHQPSVSVLPDCGIVLTVESDTDLEQNQQLATTLVSAATMFCATYSTDLHLLNNNCWKFAQDLCNVLSAERKRLLKLRHQSALDME